MGRRGELCIPTPLLTLATLLPSGPLPTQPERGCSSLLKHFQKEPFSQPLHAPGPQELREVRLQEELPPSWFLVEIQFLSLDGEDPPFS